jgi:hypothetical protein
MTGYDTQKQYIILRIGILSLISKIYLSKGLAIHQDYLSSGYLKPLPKTQRLRVTLTSRLQARNLQPPATIRRILLPVRLREESRNAAIFLL